MPRCCQRLTFRILGGDHNVVDLLDIRSRLPLPLYNNQAAYLGTFRHNSQNMTQYDCLATPLDPKTPLKVPLLATFLPVRPCSSVRFRPVWSRVGGITNNNDIMARYGSLWPI